ncbi:vWA domain-containing protein [Roseococcus sp. DSY-14]|uniref:vWA domain-containing protein n=1 Tax=Roseococcus sp. DSY-14 TaxID=3369650 RepID=UPI00387B8395
MIPPRTALPAARPGGALAANVLGFVRLLRRAGLPVGPGEAMAAAEALALAGVEERAVAHAALHATLVRRHDQTPVFDAAFALFWRDPERARTAAALAMMEAPRPEEKAKPGARRLAEAMAGGRPPPPPQQPPAEERRQDATLTVSGRELLQRMDFEAMGAAEIAAAKAEIRRLVLPLDEKPTRRFRPDPAGPRPDLRATLRRAARTGGEVAALARRRRTTRPPPLVAICDISGSMARYAQVLLHFLHALTNDRDRVHVFLFGTRLSNITRQLRHQDAEVAFEMVGAAVPDWSGGTRIGEALEEFNHRWARRVLGQGAVVLLITDGLDREGGRGLGEAMARLRRSCRRLIWLNPLLRWQGFEPRSQGIKAMLPHVHEFRPVHNLDSLRELVKALGERR